MRIPHGASVMQLLLMSRSISHFFYLQISDSPLNDLPSKFEAKQWGLLLCEHRMCTPLRVHQLQERTKAQSTAWTEHTAPDGRKYYYNK
jgi:hypothetical protein